MPNAGNSDFTCPAATTQKQLWQEFEAWYEDEISFFHDQPFYSVYRDLLKAGATLADLQYIDFLRRALAAWYRIRKAVSDELMGSRKRPKLDLSTLPKSPPGFVSSVAFQVLNAVADEHKDNPSLSGISSYEWYEKFILKPWKTMVDAQQATRLYAAEVLPFRIEEEMENRLPLYRVFAEAANRLNDSVGTENIRAGRKRDPGGSLFLLAVHERLSTIGGSSYRLAGRLFETVRSGNDPKKSDSVRHATTQRVETLKSNLKDWKWILRPVEEGFQLYIETPKPKREERKRILKDVIESQYKKGDVVPGSKPPHGGSWTYDPEKDQLTLTDPPTRYETWVWDWE